MSANNSSITLQHHAISKLQIHMSNMLYWASKRMIGLVASACHHRAILPHAHCSFAAMLFSTKHTCLIFAGWFSSWSSVPSCCWTLNSLSWYAAPSWGLPSGASVSSSNLSSGTCTAAHFRDHDCTCLYHGQVHNFAEYRATPLVLCKILVSKG